MTGQAKSIRWGILSTAKIGLEKFIPAIGRSQTGTALAIASRDMARRSRTWRVASWPMRNAATRQPIASVIVDRSLL